MCKRVDLPMPDSPTIARLSALFILKSTFFNMSKAKSSFKGFA